MSSTSTHRTSKAYQINEKATKCLSKAVAITPITTVGKIENRVAKNNVRASAIRSDTLSDTNAGAITEINTQPGTFSNTSNILGFNVLFLKTRYPVIRVKYVLLAMSTIVTNVNESITTLTPKNRRQHTGNCASSDIPRPRNQQISYTRNNQANKPRSTCHRPFPHTFE